MKPIPWQPFNNALRQQLDPTVMCLWWVPLRGQVECFVGRVVHWPAIDSAMVARRTGSLVRVTDGAFYAVVTEPEKPLAIDDAINVSTVKSLTP